MTENNSVKYKISKKIPVFGTMASVNMNKDELTKLIESNNYDFVLYIISLKFKKRSFTASYVFLKISSLPFYLLKFNIFVISLKL